MSTEIITFINYIYLILYLKSIRSSYNRYELKLTKKTDDCLEVDLKISFILKYRESHFYALK